MIERVDVYRLAVPMRRAFEHASHRREVAESILVAVGADGATGFGEGAPRPYVTGETASDAAAALGRTDMILIERLVDWSSFPAAVVALSEIDLPRLIGGLTPAMSAACALEMALLDAICRRNGRSFADAFGCLRGGLTPTLPKSVSAVLVIDLSRSVEDAVRALPPGAARNVRNVKLKVDGDMRSAVERVAAARRAFGDDVRLSIDANGAWRFAELADVAESLLALGVAWLEEPLAPRQWSDLSMIDKRLGLPVMLDESCVDAADLAIAAKAGACRYVNIRVSKCGGPLRAARLMALAQDAGIAWQVGVQVGEVGPLWAAGRALSTSLAGAVAVEAGRQDEWFDRGLTAPDYIVDRANYTADPIAGAGHGIVPGERLWPHSRRVASWQTGRGWTVQ